MTGDILYQWRLAYLKKRILWQIKKDQPFMLKTIDEALAWASIYNVEVPALTERQGFYHIICYENVDLRGKGLKFLPVKFARVSGDFDISHNRLTTLCGAPASVGGNFDASSNQLYNCEDIPRTIEGNLNLSHNYLTELSPSRVGRDFMCEHNLLESLGGMPEVAQNIYLQGNGRLGVYQHVGRSSDVAFFDEKQKLHQKLINKELRGQKRLHKI